MKSRVISDLSDISVTESIKFCAKKEDFRIIDLFEYRDIQIKSCLV